MAEIKVTEQTPEPVSKDPSHRRLVWFLAIAFVAINVLLIGIGLFTDFGVERANGLSDIITWFDTVTGGIIAAYFGVDLFALLRPKVEIQQSSDK